MTGDDGLLRGRVREQRRATNGNVLHLERVIVLLRRVLVKAVIHGSVLLAARPRKAHRAAKRALGKL